MRKTFLISQLMCMSVLFAPEPEEDRNLGGTGSESNGSWIVPSCDDLQSEAGSRYSAPFNPSEVGSGEAPFFIGLDNLKFRRWYGDYFKTYEIDGIRYFLKLNTANASFVLSEMGPDAQVSEVSISVSGALGNVFRTSNGRPTRIQYTRKQNMRWHEAKNMFISMVLKSKKITQNMLTELNESYSYGYGDHLPLDGIELQNEGDEFYLIFGIEENGLKKNSSIKEPESIRIQLKLPDDSPECYMDKNFLSMYHRIYSPINQGLTRLLAGVSDFSRVEGYSQIPDILQKQPWWTEVQKVMGYLQEDRLEPIIYIPTYQHDALIHNSYALMPFKHQGNNVFTTERVYGAKYSLYIAGLDTDFTLSDLGDKEVSRLQVNYKGESDTEFIYEITGKISGSMIQNAFKDTLPKLKDLESKFSTSHPVSLVRVRKEEDSRYLDVLVDTNAPRLQVKLGEDETGNEYLTEENISICHKLHAELQKILGPDIKSTDVYVEVPEVLKEQEFWTDIQTSLSSIGNASFLIQQTQRDALVDKGYELLPFTHWYDNWFETKVVDNLRYGLNIIDNLKDTFKLSDLTDRKINYLSVSVQAPAPGKFKQSSGNTEFRCSIWKTISGNELSDQLKIASQKARKLRDDSIAQLSKIESVEFPLAMVRIHESSHQTYLNILASDEGKKLNPKFEESEGPLLHLGQITLEEFLTEEKLTKCRDVCVLVRSKLHELLKGVTEFSDEHVHTHAQVLKKQSFWPEVQAMLNQIGTKICTSIHVTIPTYLHDALIDNSYALLPFKHKGNNVFVTERTYGVEYSLDVAGLGADFMLSDLGEKEVSRLQISYKDNYTEFIYDTTGKMSGTMVRDVFKTALSDVRGLKSEFGSNYPVSFVKIRKEEDSRYLEVLAGTNAPQLQIKLADNEANTKYLTEENISICHKLHVELQKILGPDVEPTDVYVDVPEVLKEQPFWADIQTSLNTIGNASFLIQQTQRDALVDKGYELLPFTHWYDIWFKTKVVDNLNYALTIEDITNLSDIFRLSELTDTEINLWVSANAPAPGKFKQSSGDTSFRYIIWETIPGNELSDQLKITSQKARKLRDDSIAQLSKIESVEFPLAMVGIEEYSSKTWLDIIASDEGKKLNPKFEESEGPKLHIDINNSDTMEKFLTEEKLVKCRDVCGLVRDKIHDLLKHVTEFSDKRGYTCTVPAVLKKQSFWPEAEALLKQIGNIGNNNIYVEIPEYLYDALIDRSYAMLPFSRFKHYGCFHSFKTQRMHDFSYLVSYLLRMADQEGLGDTIQLSDLAGKQKIYPRVSIYDHVPRGFRSRQSSGYTEFRYEIDNKPVSGNEVNDVFKNGVQQAKKLRDESIALLSKIVVYINLPLAMMGVLERTNGRVLAILPSDEGKKLNPKFEESEGPRIDIPNGDAALGEFLTLAKLTKCRDVCELVRNKIHELLKDVADFADKQDYWPMPQEVLERQAFWSDFWPEVQILLKQIDDNASIHIPAYQYCALVTKFG